ncbi:MAG: Holliday junction resolvase RuvX [Acidimicrobiia bacterium]|nr:Holliday junction resolvase RuvX [Acidimicrobiia bacterium]
MGRVLGVDLGARRIGLALSDPSGVVATPWGVLERSGDPAADRRAIVDVARAEGASCIVVGLPRALSGRLGPAAREVLAEVEELRATAGPELPVETHDERLTTVTAERALVQAGVRRRARRGVVDQVAAAVMLQSYLETRRAP